MQEINNPSAEDTNKSEKLTPPQLFQKHSNDPKHDVTEEELKNLKVGTEAGDEKEISKETDEKDDEIENLPNNDSLPNPFEVLGG